MGHLTDKYSSDESLIDHTSTKVDDRFVSITLTEKDGTQVDYYMKSSEYADTLASEAGYKSSEKQTRNR